MTQAVLPAHLPLRRVSDFSPGQVGVLFFVLLLLVSIPLWTHPLPPLSDYVNHLARMHVIARGAADPDLSRYYQIQWAIIPNVMMDVIVPPLARMMRVYLAGQVFTFLTFALIVSGMLALHRALFGRWSVVPFIAMPLLYNYVFLVGVMNYIFGIGLTLWALAAWIWLRDRAWPWRMAAATLFVIALFFCHLFAVGLYALGLLAWELWRLWQLRDRPLLPSLIDFCASGIPLLPVVPLLLASPTMQLATDMSWEPRGKIDGLMYVIEVYSDIVAFAMTAIIAAAAVWVVRRNLMRIHPYGAVLAVVGVVIYLAMPRILFASYMADQRLPIAVAFMAASCIDIRMHHRLVRRGFLAVLLTLLAVRVIEVDASWSDLSVTTREFRASVKRIKPGSKVLVAYADRASGDDVADLGLVHAACIAMIERSALVTTAFTVVGKQIMHVKPEFAGYVDSEDGTPPSVGQLVLDLDNEDDDGGQTDYWHGWHARYDYLYVLFTEDDAPNPSADHLTLLQDGTRFQLYRINKAPAPS